MDKKVVPKIFNDPIHGHIELHPLLVKIIDTPHFQRLRNIKQLGAGYYVFPGASHNRFEHCIGVAHLAGKLVEHLYESQENPTKRTEKEEQEIKKNKLCVQIAGLCHDLGHGPFSHLFEEFMKEKKINWKHEEQSIKMFEDLMKTKKFDDEIKNGEINQEDIKFINELISGKRKSVHKPFLYEIVNNAENGIDVDKMDYFSRDCHHLGMTSNFSHERYMKFARVCTHKGDEHICMRDKEALNMYELFHVRNLLHHNAYHHRVVEAVELMILDALTAADDEFKFSDKVKNPKDYLKLTDNVLQEILNLQNPVSETSKAQEIIKRIMERKLYKFIGGKTFQNEKVNHLDNAEQQQNKLKTWWEQIREPEDPKDTDDFKVKLIKFNYGMKDKNPDDYLLLYSKEDPQKTLKLSNDEFIKLNCGMKDKNPDNYLLFYSKEDPQKTLKLSNDELIKLNYGMEDKNPVDSLQFYSKEDPQKTFNLSKDEVSYMLPKTFSETKIMVFYKGEDKNVARRAKEKIEKFWEEVEKKP